MYYRVSKSGLWTGRNVVLLALYITNIIVYEENVLIYSVIVHLFGGPKATMQLHAGKLFFILPAELVLLFLSMYFLFRQKKKNDCSIIL